MDLNIYSTKLTAKCTIFTSKFGHYRVLYDNIWSSEYSCSKVMAFFAYHHHFTQSMMSSQCMSKGNSNGFFDDKERACLEIRRYRKATDKLVVQLPCVIAGKLLSLVEVALYYS